MTTMSDRLEKYRKFAVTAVTPVTRPAEPSKSAAFLEGAEVTGRKNAPVTGGEPPKTAENRHSELPVTEVTEVTAKNDHVEHCAGGTAGIPRDWIEGFARLRLDRPPGDVPLRRWLWFADDVGLFLESPLCAAAVALGWGPLNLFGCNRDRPFARIDQAGLLWLLNGSRLVALSENIATIERPTGALQTYRRKPSGPGQVLPWNLQL